MTNKNFESLVIFTCSTINDRYLFEQKAPWKYVNTNPKGNNLETAIKLLIKLSKSIRLKILIGNTDPYYIYSQGFKIYPSLRPSILWEKYDFRWKVYKKSLQKWLSGSGLKNFELISWREFEVDLKQNFGVDFNKLFRQYLPKISRYFSKRDFNWEISRLKLAFNSQGYFKTVPCPDNQTLKIWVRRKFTEYMIQGLLIYLFFPNSILIQNEKPTTLRNKMYQPLIKQLFGKELPIMCPFGIDDIGYQ